MPIGLHSMSLKQPPPTSRPTTSSVEQPKEEHLAREYRQPSYWTRSRVYDSLHRGERFDSAIEGKRLVVSVRSLQALTLVLLGGIVARGYVLLSVNGE